MGFFKRFTKPKAKVSLTIPSNTVELGENFSGEISVSSKDEFDGSEVRAELRCVEKRRRERLVYSRQLKRRVRHTYWDVATLHSEDIKAGGEMHLVPGFKKTYPVKVNIPAGGRESFDGLDGNIKWSLKGVVAIDGRPDVTSETIELQVIRAGTSAKEKDVIMVACEYCESLMEQTATSCPNCKAPRKT